MNNFVERSKTTNSRIICVAITVLLPSLATNHAVRAQRNSTATSAAERQVAWQ